MPKGRSTGDLLVLIVASTICAAILIAVVGVFILRAVQPKTDLTGLVGNLGDVINTMLGLMAGFLAGKTGGRRNRKDDDEASTMAGYAVAGVIGGFALIRAATGTVYLPDTANAVAHPDYMVEGTNGTNGSNGETAWLGHPDRAVRLVSPAHEDIVVNMDSPVRVANGARWDRQA